MQSGNQHPVEEVFQVDLRGVMDVLARHMYSTTDVFLRELLQNAVDAIRVRQDAEPGFEGAVTFEVEQSSRTITVIDNGAGLTEHQVREALSRVGGSTKRSTEAKRGTMIGQFGIGMLSCFMVADEITVLTQSMNDGDSPIRWRGRSGGTFTIERLDKPLPRGTQVVIRLRDDESKYADPYIVRQLVSRYGRMLTVDIGLQHADWRERVSVETQPWTFDLSDEEGCREAKFALDMWDDSVADVFRISDRMGDFVGIGVVQLGLSGETTEHRHSIYIKDMLVTDKPGELVPEWATFLRCHISSDTLRPTASREAIYEDEVFERVRESIADSLLDYLRNLAKRNQSLLRSLLSEHDLSFRRIALQDMKFFDAIIDLLPFETSEGERCFGDFVREQALVRVSSSAEQFHLCAPLARIGGTPIFNGGYTYHYELLARAASRRAELVWQPISIEDMLAGLREASPQQSILLDPLREQLLASGFIPRLRLVNFEPDSVAALYVEGEDDALARSLDSAIEVSEGVWEDALMAIRGGISDEAVGSTLCLNALSEPIKTVLRSPSSPIAAAIVRIVYIHSLIEAQQPLTSEESRAFCDALNQVLAHGQAT